MAFDAKAFAEKFANDLSVVQCDLETLTALDSEQRKDVMARVLNLKIDIKNVPEFVEAWAFMYAVNMLEGFIKNQLGGK